MCTAVNPRCACVHVIVNTLYVHCCKPRYTCAHVIVNTPYVRCCEPRYTCVHVITVWVGDREAMQSSWSFFSVVDPLNFA